jgi:radical SAM superfamily enzyme YgiQ (UPF0313 family)
VEILRDDVALVRRHYDGPVVIGGAGYSVMPVELLDYAGADFGVAGDGERSLLRWLQARERGSALAGVPGLVFRAEGRYVQMPAGEPELEGLELAPRDLVDNRLYFRRGGQIGLETKRGCPGRCIYCADPVVKGRRSRVRPPSDVAAEVQGLLGRGIDVFHLCDSEFNVPLAHAEGVCRALIEAGLGDRIRWYTYASPVPFSKELGSLMIRAGCAGVNFGVDHGSDSQLAALGRGFKSADIAHTARTCRELGLVFMYDLLLGAPGETPATLKATVDLMKSVSPDRVGISLGVRIYPGTPFAGMVAEHRIGPAGLTERRRPIDPFFYMSPALGDDPAGLMRELVGDDERFFLPATGGEQDYNYNDNEVLERAIDSGMRGAYWDVLRRLAAGGGAPSG